MSMTRAANDRPFAVRAICELLPADDPTADSELASLEAFENRMIYKVHLKQQANIDATDDILLLNEIKSIKDDWMRNTTLEEVLNERY